MPPTILNRMSAFGIGFLLGVGAQVIFRMLVLAIIGSISVFFSSQTVALVVILLAPLILSGLVLRITPGSVSESFLHGFQFGSLAWLISIIVSLLT